MERQLSTPPTALSTPPEAFKQPQSIQDYEPSTSHIDTTYPRYDRENSELEITTHKKIIPIIPQVPTEVPQTLTGLKKFIDTPVTIQEVPNKEAFMRNVFPWIVNALSDAGYDASGIDLFLNKSIDQIDFTADQEKYLADINRIVQNIGKQVFLEKNTTQQPIQPASAVSLISPVRERLSDPSSVLAPNEDVKNLIPIHSIEKETVIDSFQTKFETLTQKQFDREQYLEFLNEVHTTLRDRYDSVTNTAQNNLKRYSEFYTPSPTEKEALQFLSTLKSQYVRLQSKDSALGIVRAEVMNSLNRTDAFTDEAEVKNFTRDYLEGTKNLFTTIDTLEEMISVAHAEEKPALGEAYRTQFERLRVEGAKVLTTLPSSHNFYNEFKLVVEHGITELIRAASIENGGDKAVIERSSYFISLRDRIKAAIAYVQAEQEFENFKNRQLQQIQNLEISLSTNIETLSPEKLVIKQTILDNLASAKNSIATAGALPNGVSMLSLSEYTLHEAVKDFATQKETIKQLLTTNNEIIKDLQSSRVSTYEAGESIVRAELTPAYPPQIEAILRPLRERTQQLNSEITESTVSRKRLQDIRALIKPARMGALALLAVAFSSGQLQTDQRESGIPALDSLMGIQAQSVSNEATLNRVGIEEFLKVITVATVEAEVSDSPSVLGELVPKQAIAPVEVVPGVILPTKNDSLITPGLVSELKIYGPADAVPHDPGMSFHAPSQSEQGSAYSEKDFHTIQYGDTFWDINEGESLAGTLPVMKQINPYFKQHLIDRMRDALNRDPLLREKIGGFGASADTLITGAVMNIKALNDEAAVLAINHGYLH